MAFTSGLAHADSDTNHNIELQYSGLVRTMTLYDRPGDDSQPNKGDLWEFSLSGCVTLSAITRVSVAENGNDGWNIESIVTFVRDASSRIQVLTRNFGARRWIDGDHSSQRRYDLTLSTSDVSSGIFYCIRSRLRLATCMQCCQGKQHMHGQIQVLVKFVANVCVLIPTA